MKNIINYYEEHKKQIVFSIAFLTIFLSACISFKYINNKFSENKNVEEKIVLTKLEEKNNNNTEQDIKTIKVDIKGAIENPGVYELYENSRVIDVIEKAGGLKDNAYTHYINLSKKLIDENVIIINSIEEIAKLKNEYNKKIICENINDACLKNNELITSTNPKNKKKNNN